MRRLSTDKRTAILRCLVEGNSINATARITGTSKLTVLRLLADVGSLCADLHNDMVRGLTCQRIQVDEIWSFVGCKQKTKNAGGDGDGDCWTWVAIDADSKLVVSYLVGLRELSCAREIVQDIADRVVNRIQMTTDGLNLYLNATIDAFGIFGIDYAMLIKLYGPDKDRAGQARYSPSQCIGCLVRPTLGDPDPRHISTSYVERMNLTTRMCNRRFTRLTNAFSKKWRNHEHAIALHYFYYNFCRKHQTLDTAPAIAAGIADAAWTIEGLVLRLEAAECEQIGHARINRQDRT